MYTRLRKMLQNSKDKGFTLIELLVVIVIIGILAAIAIPIFLSQRAKATDASEKSDAHTLATEMETFYTDNQVYPGTVTATTNTAGTSKVYGFGVNDTAVMSPGNTATIRLNGATVAASTAYCIDVANTQTNDNFVYQSDQGGLQQGPTTNTGAATCTVAAYPTAVAGMP